MRNILFALGFFCATLLQQMQAQSTRPPIREVNLSGSGNIMGEKSAALHPRVRIEGTETKVYADENGHFEITVSPDHDILSFESDNYPARKVLLGNLQKVYIPVTLWSKTSKKKRDRKHE